MTKRLLYGLWAGMFILCAGLGFIPAPGGAFKFFMTGLSLLFFLPPALLLHGAYSRGDRLTMLLIRNFSLSSLVLTVALILANFLCLMAPVAVGNILYAVLVIVSSPMVCGGSWVLSLFCWTCLLLSAGRCLKNR